MSKQISEMSANTHIVAGNERVAGALEQIKKDDFISMQGYLISIENSNGKKWKSSTTRNDTGEGACELMWVTNIMISQ